MPENGLKSRPRMVFYRIGDIRRCFAAGQVRIFSKNAKKEAIMMKKRTAGKAEPVLQISVDCSCKSHLVHVNEPFEFIIESNRKQELKAVVSMDGRAVL